jgi:hypothetical protein
MNARLWLFSRLSRAAIVFPFPIQEQSDLFSSRPRGRSSAYADAVFASVAITPIGRGTGDIGFTGKTDGQIEAMGLARRWLRRLRPYFLLDPALGRPLGDLQIATDLEVDPELRGDAEVAGAL